MPLLTPSRRLRRTPFSDGVEAAGVSSYTVYNHMLLPTAFMGVEEDYHHLKNHVQVWDVSVERQVKLSGPDAEHLLKVLTPRDLSRFQVGQCLYMPFVNQGGFMLNDPVGLKLGENEFSISIADSDLLLWIKGVAQGYGFDVNVEEPDISPLAIQGPKADELAARVFGDEVRALRFFCFGAFEFRGHKLHIARSGFSKQGGFEVYVGPSAIGMELWDALFEAGRDLEVRAGCPNGIERIEGGLLSYGNDMTRDNTPFECGLGKFAAPRADSSCIGATALMRAAEAGPDRQIRALEIQGPAPACDRAWSLYSGYEWAGEVTSAAWSPDFQCTVAIAMIEKDFLQAGCPLSVQTQSGVLDGCVRPVFWI
ncbi:MAG: dimethylsulfoniopropionate demethylase [Pseudomonadota bacterium]